MKKFIAFALLYLILSFTSYKILSSPSITQSFDSLKNSNTKDSLYFIEKLKYMGINIPAFIEKINFISKKNENIICLEGKYVGTSVLIDNFLKEVENHLKKYKYNKKFYPSKDIYYFTNEEKNEVIVISYTIVNQRKFLINFIFSE